MAGIPDSVPYMWTPKDFTDAQSGRSVITPYDLPPSLIPGVRLTRAGVLVNLPIGRLKMQFSVGRFALGDDFVWEEIPPAAREAETLADLCDALKATKSPKYVDRYYNLRPMSGADKQGLARLLFDYWENTEYRYAVITGGDFNWAAFDGKRDPLKLIKTKGTTTGADGKTFERRIQRVPIFKARTGSGAVAPGPQAQTVTLPDPALSRLDPDIREIREAARRIMDLLKKSQEVLVERVRFARSFTALKVLLQVCAGASQQSAERVGELALKAKALETQVEEAMRTKKAAELFPTAGLDPHLEKVLRKELGYADDMAGEIQRLSDALCAKLVDDKGFAGRCTAFARDILSKKLTGTRGYLDKREALVVALVDAMAALNETKAPDDFERKIFAILKQVPDEPVLKASDVKDQTGLDAIFSLLGTKQAIGGLSQLATASVGNLAGPPSLWIAVVQWRAWNKLTAALSKATSDSSPALQRLLDETLNDMERGIPPTKAVRAQLRQVVEKRSQAGLDHIKTAVLDEYTGQRQASMGWKVGMLGLQVLALLMSILSARSNFEEKPGEAPDRLLQFTDILGVGGQVTQVGVGVADVALSALSTELGKKGVATYVAFKLPWHKLVQAAIETETPALAIAELGVYVGRAVAFFGAVVSLFQLWQAGRAGDIIKGISSAAGLGGNAALVVACCRWIAFKPIPGLQVIGIGLIAASTVITLGAAAYRASIPGPNQVAAAILKQIDGSPYAVLLSQDKVFKDALASLRTDCTYEPFNSSLALPLARNNSFVIDDLLRAGLGAHVALLVEASGAPLTPDGKLPEHF